VLILESFQVYKWCYHVLLTILGLLYCFIYFRYMCVCVCVCVCVCACACVGCVCVSNVGVNCLPFSWPIGCSMSSSVVTPVSHSSHPCIPLLTPLYCPGTVYRNNGGFKIV